MSVTPICNRVWNKQEKQIIRLLYRKGLIETKSLKEYYWQSFKRSGKRYRSSGRYSGKKWDNYLDEIHYFTTDYWGEVDEHPLVDRVIEHLAWSGVSEDLSKVDNDDMWEVLHSSSFQYEGRKWFIKYLKALPTVRCDSKINEVLKIRRY